MPDPITHADVAAAAERIAGSVRPVVVAPAGVRTTPNGRYRVSYALEYLQYTGTFKARGALNFLRARAEAGTLPDAGVAIASGGNAGLACAWSAREAGTTATVFVSTTAPRVKVDRLRCYGARVELVGSQFAEAAAACADFAAETGAALSHAYDHPLIAAGAGTLADEIRSAVPDVTTIVVAVGGGGLFAGVATAAHHHGIATMAVEPEHCRALNAALAAGEPVDVPVDSVAADSLGARRASTLAVEAARRTGARSVLVTDERIVAVRRGLWDDHRLVVEHAAATAVAALEPRSSTEPAPFTPTDGEHVCVVLCGANTDPSDLVASSERPSRT